MVLLKQAFQLSLWLFSLSFHTQANIQAVQEMVERPPCSSVDSSGTEMFRAVLWKPWKIQPELNWFDNFDRVILWSSPQIIVRGIYHSWISGGSLYGSYTLGVEHSKSSADQEQTEWWREWMRQAMEQNQPQIWLSFLYFQYYSQQLSTV